MLPVNIMAVDTDGESLSRLTSLLQSLWPDRTVRPFSNPMLAVQYGVNERVDVIFTEIPMRGVDGFTLVKLVREHNPGARAVFVTASRAGRADGLLAGSDGYLCKPVVLETLRASLCETL